MNSVAEKWFNIRTLEGYIDPIILSMSVKVLTFCFPELVICRNICLATDNPLDIIPLMYSVIRKTLSLDNIDDKNRKTVEYLLLKYTGKEVENDWMNDPSLVKKHEEIRKEKSLEFEKDAMYHFTKSRELSELDPTLVFIALTRVEFRGEITPPYNIEKYTDFDKVKKIVDEMSKSNNIEEIRNVVKDIIVDRAKIYKSKISENILSDIYKWHKEVRPTPTLDTTFRIFICNPELVEFEEYVADLDL